MAACCHTGTWCGHTPTAVGGEGHSCHGEVVDSGFCTSASPMSVDVAMSVGVSVPVGVAVSVGVV